MMVVLAFYTWGKPRVAKERVQRRWSPLLIPRSLACSRCFSGVRNHRGPCYAALLAASDCGSLVRWSVGSWLTTTSSHSATYDRSFLNNMNRKGSRPLGRCTDCAHLHHRRCSRTRFDGSCSLAVCEADPDVRSDVVMLPSVLTLNRHW